MVFAVVSGSNLLQLRYPHIRLALINRLLAGGDCVTAFAETACECGLRCPDDLSTVRQEVARGSCGSLTTARAILESTAPAFAAQLWPELQASIEQYLQDLGKVHCRGLNLEATALSCGGMAAAVMDVLLQLLEGHGGIDA